MEGLERITQTPGVMGGKACVRGMRVTVSMIVGEIGAAARSTHFFMISLTSNVRMCSGFRYAALLASEREVILASA